MLNGRTFLNIFIIKFNEMENFDLRKYLAENKLLNENKFEMIGSDVDELLDAVSLVNGKNIAKLKPLDTTGNQIADNKFSIEVELDNSEFIQKINSFLEENGFQIKLYKTK
jgi:hypothetical protein